MSDVYSQVLSYVRAWNLATVAPELDQFPSTNLLSDVEFEELLEYSRLGENPLPDWASRMSGDVETELQREFSEDDLAFWYFQLTVPLACMISESVVQDTERRAQLLLLLMKDLITRPIAADAISLLYRAVPDDQFHRLFREVILQHVISFESVVASMRAGNDPLLPLYKKRLDRAILIGATLEFFKTFGRNPIDRL